MIKVLKPKHFLGCIASTFFLFTMVSACFSDDVRATHFKALEGIWELTGLDDGERTHTAVESTAFGILKSLLFISKDEFHEVSGISLSMGIRTRELLMPENNDPSGIDFLIPFEKNNVLYRGRYMIESGQFAYCVHKDPLHRPKRVVAVLNEQCVWKYKRIHARWSNSGVESNAQNSSDTSGLWETVGLEIDGKRMEEEGSRIDYHKRKKAYFFYKGKGIIMEAPNLTRLQTQHVTYTNKREELDFLLPGNNVIKAIHELNGNRLSICWVERGEKRPREIGTSSGDGRVVLHLRRVGR